jgi:aminomuconate-semialdehyde/2-hydroxymuconate-6-semialdehyde dehydrogenase
VTIKLPEHTTHFINGVFVPSIDGKTFANISPSSNEHLADMALGSTADVNAAVDAAKKALKGPWGTMPLSERCAIVKKIGDLILENKEYLANLESADSGKPLSESLTGDIPRAAANFHFFADLAAKQESSFYTSDDGSTHEASRCPIGVVGLITPWNLPLYLATWKLAPALAQGNTVLLKPAELTPLTATAFGDICNQAGLPPGVVNVIHGFGAASAGQAIVSHPEIKAISFTGETLTGSAIMKDAAPHLKKLSFELGGKGASVIFADADLDKAAAIAARAAFRNQGQICLAGSRLIVEKSVAEKVVTKIKEHIDNIKIGDPLNIENTMGALVCKDHRDKVASYVEMGRKEDGVEVICGGKIPEGLEHGAYYEPTIITGVSQSSKLIQEEIFGPVLTVQTFSTLDEAMDLLNGTPYGLSCSLWSESEETTKEAAAKADTGLVWINSWFLRNFNTPFGGTKRSGIGREGGNYSLDFFSEYKTISTPSKEGK